MPRVTSNLGAGYPLAFLFLFLVGTSSSVLSQELRAEQVKRPDGSSINYYLTKNRADTWANTLLVILQGSSCESVQTIRSIANTYSKLIGDADVLTVEKYGITPGFSTRGSAEHVECPDDYYQHDDLEQRKSDVLATLQHISSKHTYERRILFGGSEGATLAIALSSRDDLIDAAIGFNAGGRYFRDDVIHGMKQSIGVESDRQEAILGFTEFVSQFFRQEPFPVKMSDHGYGWWKSVLENDQLSNLLEATVPVFVVQGGRDQSVSPVTWMDLRRQVESSDQKLVNFHYYPDLDHGLRDQTDQDKSELVMTDIRSWLDSVLSPNHDQGN